MQHDPHKPFICSKHEGERHDKHRWRNGSLFKSSVLHSNAILLILEKENRNHNGQNKRGNGKFWMRFAFSGFLFYVCRLTNICKAKQAAVKCWKGDVLWDTVLSYTCVWFWRDSARRDPSTGNFYRIEYLEAPRRFIMRPRVCNSLHFSNNCRVCWECRTEEWWMDKQTGIVK